MSKNINVLVIVEGNRAEPKLFHVIEEAYGLKFQFFCISSNIYLLYKKVKEWGFFDIKQVLLEIHNDQKYKDVLQRDFAYTYLVFDCDAHHREEYEKGYPIEDIVAANMNRVKEMLEYFNNETDPTVGKLYVNYPMLESFKHADYCFDENYVSAFVPIDQLVNYKRIVGTKKLANKRVDSYTRDDLNNLIKMNVFKLNSLSNQIWGPMDYSEYIEHSNGLKIFTREKKSVDEQKQIAVLNTSLFLLLDYFGNRNGFYDSIVKA